MTDVESCQNGAGGGYQTEGSNNKRATTVTVSVNSSGGYGIVESVPECEALHHPRHLVDMIQRAEHNVLDYAKTEAGALLLRIPLTDGEREYTLEASPVKQREPLLDKSLKAAWAEEQKPPRREHQQSVGLAALAFSRSMIGTAVLYLPRMFYTGGLAFSTAALVLVASVSTFNMIILSRVHDRVGAPSFSALGRVAFGRPGELLVESIICLTQVGWVSGYLIFVQQNVAAALPGLESALHLKPRVGLLLLQLVVLVPLSWVRRLSYLSLANFLAQVCVLVGLVICLGYSGSVLVEQGGPAPFHWFNPQHCALFLGTVAVSFEGMSLTLPIKRSMREPELFGPMVCVSMTVLCLLFWLVGAIGYLAWGDDGVATFATNNLPKQGFMGPTVRLAYSAAVLLTYPLQLFPAVALLEKSVFHGSDLRPSSRKLLKNLFRTLVVCFTCAVAILVGRAFDNFASLIGALGSVPLAFILAPSIHLKLFAHELSPARRALEGAVIATGVAAMLLSTAVTLSTWTSSS